MTTNNTNNDTSASDSTPTDWQPYKPSTTITPWHPDPVLPGCEDWDDEYQWGLAIQDGISLYVAPDIPKVREHNIAARKRWDAAQEDRRRESAKRRASMSDDDRHERALRLLDWRCFTGQRCGKQGFPALALLTGGDHSPRDAETNKALRYLAPLVNDQDLTREDLRDAIIRANELNGSLSDPKNKNRAQVEADIDRAISKFTEPFDWTRMDSERGIPAEIRKTNGASVNRSAGTGAALSQKTQTNSAATESAISMPKLWNASDLKPGKPVEWLARQRIPRSAVSLLVGEEGIGKSLFWIWIVAAITTGAALPAFGIEQGQPQPVVLAVTEDDWQDTVRPRLEVAGANLDMVRLICIDDDGSGAPVFPRDGQLIIDADPAPVLVVIDPWLDTVSPDLKVRNTQDARLALHPFKEIATKTKAAILLVTHTNRLDSSNPRDLYGVSATLRQKARMSLFCIENDEGNLVVGPEKANMTQLVNATILTKQSVWHFQDRFEDEGSVPRLQYIGQSDKTIRQHVAEMSTLKRAGDDETVSAQVWLAGFLRDGPQWSNTVVEAAKERGISKDRVDRAKLKIHAISKRVDGNGGWFMCLPEHEGRQPETPR
ncbi:hypothetical protein B8W69_06570 [Mycobacterium vulneris]|uniref:AAA+ ATPase domain-containing protein n=1 Tax=Mycolicibacterium vulneris TaxID=547163 RepID=A0A1X2L9U4_9MYCO|nr:AAA family ATPase [Mycolicibacterium vulneris]OSC30695.1 hypothetical protein B8W69_06570 [Mycolicibacterium vulneris]